MRKTERQVEIGGCCDSIAVMCDGVRLRGRPKRTWKEVVEFEVK